MLMLEPDLSIGGYDEVRFYRKTWFIFLLLLFLAPLILPIVVTGPYFQKARAKQEQQSPAAVWRSTGGGRLLFAVIALFYTAQAAPVLVPMIGDAVASLSSDDSDSSETSEADEAAVSAMTTTEAPTTTAPATTATTSAPTTVAPTTAAPTTTFAPAVATSWNDAGRALTARRLADLEAITSNMADELLGTSDVDLALVTLTGDPRFGDNPIPDDAELSSVSVAQEQANDRLQIGLSFRYRTQLSADEAVSFLLAEYGARGFVEDETVTTDDDGERSIEVDFEVIDDDVFIRDSTLFEVTDGEDGVMVRVFRFIFEPELVDATSPLGLVSGIYPVPVGYETTRTEIRMGGGLSESGATYTNLALRTARPEAYLDLDDIKDDFVASGGDLWMEDRRTERALYLDAVNLDADAYFFVSSGDTGSTVKIEVGL